ncbi:MAG: N-acetylmuramoyl-L-alanine amidase [Lachnospiraceae bacterium]|nr:N-acetylmuramoyl-L-alanine amidase [Lachnospiraceae bacterium]
MSASTNRKTILYSIALGLLCISVMIYYGMRKPLETAAEVKAQTLQKQERPLLDGDFSDIYRAEHTDRPLCITLPEGYEEQKLQLAEDYAHRCVQVLLPDLGESYFEKTKLTGSAEGIEDMICRYEDGEAELLIYLKQVWACEEAFSEGKLELSFVRVREKYDRLVVLDAGCGGQDTGIRYGNTKEKDITLDIATRLGDKLGEKGIKVLYTRLEDEEVLQQSRLALANESSADLFLSIHCAAEADDVSKFGVTTYYNDEFFIPEFGNADFAYEVENNLSHAAGCKALGIEAGQNRSELLKYAMMPAAYVEIGYLSNDEERQLLEQDEYREKIAEGLFDAMMSSYEMLGQ